ncbi:single-stranded DNA-binding protein [Pantanalinema rosaneae CENA516]|uniref:single-stranded DNA-binding protein n=1 Tax=Pantanalinema rosaneae TaxID=1620701 RepID=UPI003D6FCDAE
MNSCILMAEIVQEPTLRSTPDTQTPMTDMVVEFPGLRPDDPASRLRIVGWGNLAQDMQERYQKGDRVVIEGRLSMTTVENPEGYKEKRAELIAQRIHRLEANALWERNPTGVAAIGTEQFSAAKRTETPAPRSTAAAPNVKSPTAKFPAKVDPLPETNLDDIPF